MTDDLMSGSADGSTQLAGSIDKLSESTGKLSTGANAFAKAITTAFAQGVTGAKSFDSVLKSLALQLSNLSLSMALKPLTQAIGSNLNSLFTTVNNATGSGAINLGLGSNNAQPFATGGVIGTPTYFPLGNRVGLAGEAGPEAIMPLTRGSDGRLGVAAAGGGAPNVTVNIATSDAESFRRSDVYLTGLIARAVARGQRGL
jgi:X-X-X-Leu-X-X-Gly heptad repeat protein